jgi:hypothetical protein
MTMPTSSRSTARLIGRGAAMGRSAMPAKTSGYIGT